MVIPLSSGSMKLKKCRNSLFFAIFEKIRKNFLHDLARCTINILSALANAHCLKTWQNVFVHFRKSAGFFTTI